jgi:succinate dehydrogenase / fumarate reductase iron-sulfur subunit
MAQFFLPRNSRINRHGRVHAAPPGARAARQIRIYRFDPSSNDGPRLDSFAIDAAGVRPHGARRFDPHQSRD